MRVVILHSDVPPDAPPDEQDTLLQAAAIEKTLIGLGHDATCAVFVPDSAALDAMLTRDDPDVVFNLVETVWGSGLHAPIAAAMLGQMGVPFTGAHAAPMAACGDKVLTKRVLKGAKLPTPGWSEPPHWKGIGKGRWIVKSVTEDASFGLDDGAVVEGREAVAARAQSCAARLGGRWFAERFIDGREFNVALVERDGAPHVLPIGEMVFEHWDESRPRIVGYAAKWNEATPEYRDTTRVFGWHEQEPDLRKSLEKLARDCWALFGLNGYARVDFRVDAENRPYILEVNPNPCLEPNAGFAAACVQAGVSYDELIDEIVRAASKADFFRDAVRAEDAAAVETLVRATGVFSLAEIAIARELVEENLAKGAEVSGYHFLVADGADGIDGYTCFGPISGTHARYELYWIAVDPKARRAGLGKRLQRATEARVKSMGGAMLIAETSTTPHYAAARGFYASQGYTLLAEIPDWHDDGDGLAIFGKRL